MILTVDELIRLKERSHYSYRELAEKSGVPVGTVQKIPVRISGGWLKVDLSPIRQYLKMVASLD